MSSCLNKRLGTPVKGIGVSHTREAILSVFYIGFISGITGVLLFQKALKELKGENHNAKDNSKDKDNGKITHR